MMTSTLGTKNYNKGTTISPRKQRGSFRLYAADSRSRTCRNRCRLTPVAALQANAEAHKRGLEQGAGIGVGVALLLFGTIFGIRRITGTPQKKLGASAYSISGNPVCHPF